MIQVPGIYEFIILSNNAFQRKCLIKSRNSFHFYQIFATHYKKILNQEDVVNIRLLHDISQQTINKQEVNKINSIRIKYMFKCDTNSTLTT